MKPVRVHSHAPTDLGVRRPSWHIEELAFLVLGQEAGPLHGASVVMRKRLVRVVVEPGGRVDMHDDVGKPRQGMEQFVACVFCDPVSF